MKTGHSCFARNRTFLPCYNTDPMTPLTFKVKNVNIFAIIGGEMAIDKETVKYVAHLARIELQPNELEKLSGELDEILGFIDKLKNLNVEQVNPASHILPINNVLREDEPHVSLAPEKALENAPSKQGNFFSVPKIIE